MRIPVVMVAVTLFITGVAAGFSNPVAAGTKPILAVGPGIADSDCVGETATPVCAVETWLACLARIDVELCARAAPQLKMLFHPAARQLVIKYQISAVQVISRMRIAKGLTDFQIEPGDVEIRLRQSSHLYKDGNFNVDSVVKESYFLTPRNGNWIVLAWTDENAPETCGEYEGTDERYYRRCYIFIYDAEEPWVHDRRVESRME